MFHNGGMPVDWGTVPDWVGAVGSVLAFAAIAVGLWREWRLARLARRDDQARQARLVFIRSLTIVDRTVIATVSNASSEPVFDVTLIPAMPGELFLDLPDREAGQMFHSTGKLFRRWVELILEQLYARSQFFLSDGETITRTIAPSETARMAFPLDFSDTTHFHPAMPSKLPAVRGGDHPLPMMEIRLTDNNGIRWSRGTSGQPRRLFQLEHKAQRWPRLRQLCWRWRAGLKRYGAQLRWPIR